ncbi:polysaccharide biosynthesis C-terminal domain-containing protein [Ileibacterium valens]|uniref:Uncharacterized protein n=1 Tax=Ileibacterium valens TaxID=1862668 RepID=A0A1U7NEI7_9FIRM|nr:polysaccharide biosynthesis C-terminal domain-containing protein [Ileibacterium valens]OLU36336.1 hypothetical protein BM735_12480 [Erysipelotrichaceae bacterium NYU-BL-F16]OLU38057.1 hypothetical protein BO222_09085 [Ileibacterium valens]OLU40707.1 hypothetical protein BO224_05030 [Erysipelotrichaceae bacterium NYU-BL-E8]
MNRERKARLNIISSLLYQLTALFCGLIIPRLLIDAFGSAAYGATMSIAQFLSYITLFEGGIGGVARALLYEPLARQKTEDIARIVYSISRFFKWIAFGFLAYTFVLACIYKQIAHFESFSFWNSFLLVLVISISTMGQYYIGMAYQVLLQASQLSYVTNFLAIVTSLVNTALILILVHMNCSLIVVKLFSSIVFVIRPLVLSVYVKRKFQLPPENEVSNIPKRLPGQWSGLSQHLAYFFFSNTDVVVLTLMKSLSLVSVYSVYSNVVKMLQGLTNSFSAGMEALFGELLARGKDKQLSQIFTHYETLISMVSISLFSVALLLIVPFVRIYTRGVTDADYIQPVFGFVLILAILVECLRAPYHCLCIAAGHFKQTEWAAYGETLINILFSVLLVIPFGLSGVAAATLCASAFRFLYYVYYLQENILRRRIYLFFKRALINTADLLLICLIGSFLLKHLQLQNFFEFILTGGLFTALSILITVGVNALLDYKETKWLFGKFMDQKKSDPNGKRRGC